MLQVISIVRVSTAAGGAQAGGPSQGPAFATDSKIAFWSSATNLVSGDTNARYDIFLKDIATGDVTRISTSSAGIQGSGNSYTPWFSSDGNTVAFYSDSNNLVAGDTNNTNDVFVKNLTTGVVTRASTSSGGVQGNGNSSVASLSADGNLVVFMSHATNLVASDTNSERDIFLKNISTGAITRMSADAGGVEANAGSEDPVISANGGKVAFWSLASNLAAGDTNNTYDVFVKDVATGAVSIASSTASGTVGNFGSFDPIFSSDGTKVAFRTASSNLVSGDTNGAMDIFVKDLMTGAITLISSTASGDEGNADSFSPVFSPDGSKVAFASRASNLVSGDTNGVMDIFVKDLTTGEIIRVSRTPEGTQAFNDCFLPAWSPDGSIVAFHTASANLVGGDTNGVFDIYAVSLEGQLTIPGSDGDDSETGGAADDSIYGGLGNDTLDGGAGNDLVDGGEGNDVIYGGAGVNYLIGGEGNDSVIGGPGIDSMEGNAGNDTLEGNGGDDTLDGGADNDSLLGGAGFDSLLGGDGEDYLNGGADSDYMGGGAGMDTLYGGDGNEVMTGGADNDVLYGEAGNDRVVGEGGDDTLIGDAGSDSLIGGDGNDSMSGGTENDYFDGGNDNDTIDGGAGNDSMLGGDGIDTLTFATATTGLVIDAASGSVTSAVYGNDTISGFEVIISGIGDDSVIGGAVAETLNGGDGNDTVGGGAGADSLIGGAGADFVSYAGSNAAVEIHLNTPDHSVYTFNTGSHAQGDTLTGIEGVIGSAYGDKIWSASVGSTLYGGGGNDTLTGQTGSDVVYGEAGNDSLIGGTMDDTLDGGNDDDILDGRSGADSLEGGAGNDTATYLFSSAGVNVSLTTGVGTGGDAQGDTLSAIEKLIGSTYADTLFGSSNNDTLEGGAGADSMDAGAGTDFVSYATSNAAVEIHLNTPDHSVYAFNTGSHAQGDTLTGFEGVIGSAYSDKIWAAGVGSTLYGGGGNDSLTGQNGSDVVYGEAGADSLIGGALDDTLDGGDGNDTLNGGAGVDSLIGSNGTDTLTYFTSASGVTVSLATGTGEGGDAQGDTISGIERLIGSSQADGLIGSAASDTLDGGNGNDTLIGGAGADSLIGGGGLDFVSYAASGSAVEIHLNTPNHSVYAFNVGSDAEGDTITGFEGVIGSVHGDKMWAGSSGSTLYGGEGNDSLTGQTGNDALYGEAGNDQLNGSSGSDTFDGGEGADTLIGGTGADRFFFGALAGGTGSGNRDIISDFSQAQGDLIDFSAYAPGALFLDTGAFTGGGAEIRYYQFSGATIIEVDANADTIADYQIQLNGLLTPVSGDFIV